MQISPGCTLGNNGRAFRAPERFVKSDGIQTLVMKLRFVQSLPGRSFTRVDFFAPVSCAWRTILRFLEKGFGTDPNHISRAGLNQTTPGSGLNIQDFGVRSQYSTLEKKAGKRRKLDD